MPLNTLLIKNMVCHRCVLSVEDILQQELIPFQKVIFGEIHLNETLSLNQRERLIERLEAVGFELIDNHSTVLIEKIKQLVIKRARNEAGEMENKIKLSHYISGSVNHEYTYISSFFSAVEGRTIENYFIEQ